MRLVVKFLHEIDL